MSDVLLDVRGVSIEYPLGRRSHFTAVRDVSFSVSRRETFALIGESGSGKTTTARAILGLHEPAAGAIELDGELISGKGRRSRDHRRISAVLQDPHEALNPRRRALQSVMEPMEIQRTGSKRSRRERALELLETVGLNPEHGSRYPHQMSGGQKQRVNIARALATEPSLLVCDEPVSALDVSIQAEILNLLADLRDDQGIACLLISHDLGVVAHMADHVAVMYLGEVVEYGPVAAIVEAPQHPYTQALLAAQPLPLPSWSRHQAAAPLQGEVPSPMNPPSGCRFRTRCSLAHERCAVEEPVARHSTPDSWARCHLATGGETPVAVTEGGPAWAG